MATAASTTYSTTAHATTANATTAHAATAHATTAHATTAHAATTWDEYSAYNTLRYPLQRMRDWPRSILEVLSDMWKHEYECTSLIIIREKHSRFGYTRIIQPN